MFEGFKRWCRWFFSGDLVEVPETECNGLYCDHVEHGSGLRDTPSKRVMRQRLEREASAEFKAAKKLIDTEAPPRRRKKKTPATPRRRRKGGR